MVIARRFLKESGLIITDRKNGAFVRDNRFLRELPILIQKADMNKHDEEDEEEDDETEDETGDAE